MDTLCYLCWSLPGKHDVQKSVLYKHNCENKKIVPFLPTVSVGPEKTTVRRSSKWQRNASVIDTPHVHGLSKEESMDLSDKDSAKYTTSLWTNRWYLQIIFWLLGRGVHAFYIVAVDLVHHDLAPEWGIYTNKHSNDRRKFHAHLHNIALTNKCIKIDWDDPSNEATKPAWMPQTQKNGMYHIHTTVKFVSFALLVKHLWLPIGKKSQPSHM